jgi:CubicO group peptidase (beta-lactamase class C family)
LRLTVARPSRKFDRIFAKWTGQTPGCVAGVSANGKMLTLKAYGMADLEHDVPNTADTIFEAGSVSKQFTAAAVLLLVRDGKVSLDDTVRKFIPELPDYGTPITLRHMLTHTSGLRDWGSVMYVAGWPRGTRQYTHTHVLDIVSRQTALNFAPGSRWSYSNTGYNLAAIVVERVTGMSLQDFTRSRIFEPLGMTHTSWRDDHARVVRGRAAAYAAGPQGFRTQMPFENVYGNGGLLTTVADLLKWNENFWSPRVGDARFAAEMQERGHLKDGRAVNYALGLTIDDYRGGAEISHSGVTAGYSAYLARYPAEHLSLAVLCNVTVIPPEDYGHAMADLYLSRSPAQPATVPQEFTIEQLSAYPGLYRSADTGVYLNVIRDERALRLRSGVPLIPLGGSRFRVGNRASLAIYANGAARLEDASGGWDLLQRVAPASPSRVELKELLGTYASRDAQTTMIVALHEDKLVLRRGPESMDLTPLYADAFGIPGGVVTFRRNDKGMPIAFTVSVDRVWSLPFLKEELRH